MLWKDATNVQASAFKGGIFGDMGSGKSVTAALIAIELAKRTNPKTPTVAWFDTENGFAYVAPLFKAAGVKAFLVSSQSFADLRGAIREAEQAKMGVMVVDSITHPWRNLVAAFKEKHKIRQRQLPMWAWDPLKTEWREGWANPYVNSSMHIMMLGRQSNVFEDVYDEDKKERTSYKVGTKMATEGETGYEPSLLIEMHKDMDIQADKASGGEYQRKAFVVKDRFMALDGQTAVFLSKVTTSGGKRVADYAGLVKENKPWQFVLPHMEMLAIGGHHPEVSEGHNTEALFEEDGRAKAVWREKRDKEVAMDKVKELLTKHFPASTAVDKKARGDLIEASLGTRSWTEVEQRMRPGVVIQGAADLEMLLNEVDRDLLGAALEMGIEDGKLVDGNAAVKALVGLLRTHKKLKLEAESDLDAILPPPTEETRFAPSEAPIQQALLDVGELEVHRDAALAPATVAERTDDPVSTRARRGGK